MEPDPDLDSLVKIKLFSIEEARLIKEKRKEYDFAIFCRRCDGVNIFNAIEFELNLLDDIQNRRTKSGIMDRQYDLELDVVKRIVKVYNSLVAHGDRMRILQSSPLEQYQLRIAVCLQNLCSLHPKSEHVWQITARWFIDQKSYDSARKYLHKGLHYNCKSEILFYEMFYLELEIENHNPSKVKNFARANSVFNSILNHLSNDSNTDFTFSLLDLAGQYGSVTADFQNEIITAMKAKLSNLEDFWHMLALRELEGKHYDPRINHFMCNSSPMNEKTQTENCILVYNEGTNRLSTPVMWKYFLTTLNINDKFDDSVRLTYLRDAYRLSKAKSELFMEEYHILKLIELTHAQDKEEIFRWATQYLPKSEKLWSEYMLLYYDRDHRDKLEEVFAKGIQALEEKALSLWQQKIRYYTTHRMSDHEGLVETIRHIYLNGVVNQPKEVVETLQLNYLDWLVVEKGLSSARKAYLSFTKEGLTMECHNKMLKYESSNDNPNQDVVQGILGFACKMYGTTEVDCWINYVEHLMKKDPGRVDAIYAEAIRNLDPDKRPAFDLRFKLLKATKP